MNVERDLSDLQWFILQKAAAQELVYYPEILEEYFGWKPRRLIRSPDSAYTGGYHFSRRAIGETSYCKAMTTLSRSCLRLQARGLVECIGGPERWTAVTITDKGRKWLAGGEVER